MHCLTNTFKLITKAFKEFNEYNNNHVIATLCDDHNLLIVSDPPMYTYDNATDNPVYALNIPNGSDTFPKSAAKFEEEPCPLYEELDINLGI